MIVVTIKHRQNMISINDLTATERGIVENALRSYEKDVHLKVDLIETSPACNVGENFMSIVTKVNVLGHHTANREPFTRLLIMKRVPQNEAHRILFRCDVVFRNEVAFYQQVLPTMVAFCGGDRLFLPFTSCYHSSPELLLIRHLQEDNFVMADRKHGLPFAECSITLKALGRFHGVSLSMKHSDPQRFKTMRSKVQEIALSDDPASIFYASIENSISMALKCLRHPESAGRNYEGVIQKLENIKNNVYKTMKPLMTPKEPLSVICHGDCWNNNILYHYSNDAIVQDVMFIDLQGSRYASPALDLLTFLYSSSAPGLTQTYFDEFMEMYHASLVKTMQKFSPSAPEITLDQIRQEINDYSLFGYLITNMLLPVVTYQDVEIDFNVFNNDTMMSKEFQDAIMEAMFTPKFRQCVRNLTDEFMNRGFL